MQVVELLQSGALTLAQLQTAPYYIKVRTENGLTVLNYDQIDSPEHNNIVQECRGLILDEQFNPVSVSFHRFSNFNPGKHKLDFSKFRAYDKLDGSLITLYFHQGFWKFATRGNASANGYIRQCDMSFDQLLALATKDTPLNQPELLKLDPALCFVFELTSQHNTIVTPYSATKLSLLTVRNKHSGQEFSFAECDTYAALFNVSRPSYQVFSSAEAVSAYLKSKPVTYEGVVLTQESTATSGHIRYKFKSPAYVALHHLKGEVTDKNLLQVLLYGEKTELQSSLPDESARIEALSSKLERFKTEFNTAYTKAQENLKQQLDANPKLGDEARRQIFAQSLKDYPHKNLAFACHLHGKKLETLLLDYDPAKLIKILPK